MPTFELSDVRDFIGPTALTSRCASTPPPTTTTTGITPGHALFDTPPSGSQPPNLERAQRSRTATKRSVQWNEEKEKTKDRSAKVRRARTRNANRGRGAKTSRRSHSRRIESSPEPTDTDGNTSEGTSTKGEKQADMEAVVVQVPQENHSDDDELDYETLVYIPREKLLEELGATNPENYLHTCQDEELRVLVQRFRDYQLSCTSDYQKGKDSESGDYQAAAVDAEEQHLEATAPPSSTTLLNIGGGHHLAYPPSKDPSATRSPGPSSHPYNHPSSQPMFNLPHLREPCPTTTEPGPSHCARELSLSPLHDYYRDIDSQFENTGTATAPEDTATVPEDTATEPENTAAEPMVIDPTDTAIEPMTIELGATSNPPESLASEPEINPFLLRPVPRPVPRPDPAEPLPSSRPSSNIVVPTSRPASDGIQSRSGSQRADGSQNNGPQLPTPLASPARIHSDPPAAPTAPVGVHTAQPNIRRSNAPSTSPSLGARNGCSTQANFRPPNAPSSSPSLSGAPNGRDAPASVHPPSRHASAQLDARPAGRNSSQGAGAQPSGPGPHRRSASRRSATRATLSPLGPRQPGSSAHRTPSHAGAQPSQHSAPIKVSSSSVSRVGSAPADCRQLPSSLTLLLAEARGDLGVVPQNANAQAGPSSASNTAAQEEAARARADACVDMRAHRNPDEPSTSQVRPPTPTPMRAPAPANIMLDNDTERRAAEAERTGQYFPLARDVTGNARQVLVIAKMHLFIFILLNGPYETRLTYLVWARAIFELTWHQQFPDLAFEWPEVDVAEIMVNYLPTLRGRVKEELRSVLELYINFRNPVCNDEDLEYNHALYKVIHPLGFYCVEWVPRKGHYQSEIIPRAIAKALFQGPHSIGVLFGHYFVGDRIPETLVCYILANLQFCIEEWSTGRFKAGDLGDGNMYHKYIAHRMGLRAFRDKSPKRLGSLQEEWLVYCRNYSGAAFVGEVHSQPILDPSEIREDTPATEIDETESVTV